MLFLQPPKQQMAKSIFTILLVAVSMLTGCRSENTPTKPITTESEDSLTKVSLQLNWFPEAEHGGYYTAALYGYFEEEGLEVEILPGGPNSPVIQQLVSGQADFIVGNADQVLTSRAKESGAVALLAPLQNSPRCIMVHEESGIETLADLKSMTLGISAGRAFALYMQKHLPMEDIKIVGYPGNPSIFANDQNFGQQAYVFSEPFIAKTLGANPRTLMVSDIGYNPYTSLLIATQQRIASEPKLIEKIVRASQKGWIHYLKDATKTNEHIHSLNKEMGSAILAFGAKTLQSLCLPDELSEDQLGKMTLERWTQLRDQLIEIELIDDTVNPVDAFLPTN